MRFASSSSTREARREAYSSRAVPPESISTTMAATRYCRSKTAVTIETPARKSEPNSQAHSFLASCTKRGKPPASSVTYRGTFAQCRRLSEEKRMARCTAIAAAAITATGLAPRGEVSMLGVLVKSANLLEVPNQAFLLKRHLYPSRDHAPARRGPSLRQVT